MKPMPTPDYPVRVQPNSWDAPDPDLAYLFDGIYTMTLNFMVDVVFVPDISATGPPWDGHAMPATIEAIRTPEEARYTSVMLGQYVVTPNADRVGHVDRFTVPVGPDDPATPTVVRYVGGPEFARFAADLERLTGVVGQLHPDITVSRLQTYEVMRFVQADVVVAPWFRDRDAAWLGRVAV